MYACICMCMHPEMQTKLKNSRNIQGNQPNESA